MTFIEKAINAGFEEQLFKSYKNGLPYNVKNGWFGVTRQHPDAWLKKGYKEIIISLQGLQTPHPKTLDGYKLMDSVAVRYLGFKDNGKIVYETFCGVLPPAYIIDKFLQP